MTLHASATKVCQEAMALLRQELTLNDTHVRTCESGDTGTPVSKVERACHREYENSRHEVIDSHVWSFTKDEVRCVSTMCDGGRFTCEVPADASRVVACYHRGAKVDWTKKRGRIYSSRPIDRIVYQFDEEDVGEWTPLARRALVCVIAKNLSMEITGRTNDAQLMVQNAAHALNLAKTDDSRQSNVGSQTYGRNYLVDCMTGKLRPMPHGRI